MDCLDWCLATIIQKDDPRDNREGGKKSSSNELMINDIIRTSRASAEHLHNED